MGGSGESRFPSPLRYPGGKGKIANFLKLVFLENGYLGFEYVEPYAGGASVALALLFEEFASRIHINDINKSIHAFWYAVLNDVEDLCRMVSDTPVTVEQWRKEKSVQNASDPDPLDLAFSTFFLNRTNRSGIIDGGVIGGTAQTGEWSIDARFNKPALIRRLKKIARYRHRITLTRMDALEFIEQKLPSLPDSTVVYLDPPYFVKGEGLYENFYTHKDHVEISHRVRGIRQPWIVSYDAAPKILELYSEFPQETYSLSYSAATRHRGSEVMVYSPAIRRPVVDSPSNIRIGEVQQVRMASLGL